MISSLLLATMLSTSAQADPIEYSWSDDSWLYVLVRYERSAALKGHDHVVGTNDFSGSLTWDPDDPSACSVSIEFPVANLIVDPEGSRDRFGFHGTTPDKDKTKIKDNLMGKWQLQADQYPKISYQSSACAADGDKVKVTGTLTMHGVGESVTVPMDIDASAESFSAEGSFTLTHSDFGFDPFTAVLGALRNAPELEFHVDVKATPAG